MKYCTQCAAPLSRGIPPGDDHERFFCPSCGTIHYENPKVVVGCIPDWKDRILLCRRAIEPRRGFWTLPAGFMEMEETMAEGARRELLEEAKAMAEDFEPFALYDLDFVSQIYMMFRCKLTTDRFAPGEESLEAALFAETEIPWEEIAFTVISDTMKRYFEDRKQGRFQFHTGRITR